MSSYEDLLHAVLAISARAAEVIRQVYATNFEVDYKVGDDPVTLADREANAIICAALARLTPGVPIVAEESDPSTYVAWRGAARVWFVDPLDGTRDFVKKNGEFAVMIGLAEAGRSVLGVIEGPADRRRFVGAKGIGAFEVMDDARWKPIHVSRVTDPAEAHLVVSRSHPSPQLRAAAGRLGVKRTTEVGSAGIKAMRVAHGGADLYAHLGVAGWRWDTCAPEAIVHGAGGTVTDACGAPIDYAAAHLENSSGILVSNGFLHEAALAALK